MRIACIWRGLADFLQYFLRLFFLCLLQYFGLYILV